MKIKILVAVLSWVLAAPCFAATPVLHFSDITDGPTTGLTDDKVSNQGAIVTIWGVNLGTPTLTSGAPQSGYSISVGGTAPVYVYTWENASPAAGHPADNYIYHKMQIVQFALSSSTDTTVGNQPLSITVTTPDGTSNGLAFTARTLSTNHIYFVCPAVGGCGTGSATGSDAGGVAGSWAHPWATMMHAVYAMATGDTAYIGSLSTTTAVNLSANTTDGTASSMMALLAYPGQTPTINTGDGHGCFAGTYPGHTGGNFWALSRFQCASDAAFVWNGIDGGRIVGNEGTQQCAYEAQAGMFNGQVQQPNGQTYLGNWLHDIGVFGPVEHCYANFYSGAIETTPSTWQQGVMAKSTPDGMSHVNYFENRYEGGSGGSACTGTPVQNGPIELGWNLYQNNPVRGGTYFGEEYCPAGWSGTSKVHDHVFKDQVDAVSVGGNASLSGHSGNSGFLMTFNGDFYNNLFIWTGQYDASASSNQVIVNVHSVPDTSAWGLSGTINFLNNTVVGAPSSVLGIISFSGLSGGLTTAVVNWRNNIVWKNNTVPFYASSPEYDTWSNPTAHTNNLWYYSGGTTTAPSWDTSPVITDPKFTNAGTGDFSLQAGSPALNAGANLTATVPKDFLGNTRPTAYPAIGAFDLQGSNGTAPTLGYSATGTPIGYRSGAAPIGYRE